MLVKGNTIMCKGKLHYVLNNCYKYNSNEDSKLMREWVHDKKDAPER